MREELDKLLNAIPSDFDGRDDLVKGIGDLFDTAQAKITTLEEAGAAHDDAVRDLNTQITNLKAKNYDHMVALESSDKEEQPAEEDPVHNFFEWEYL